MNRRLLPSLTTTLLVMLGLCGLRPPAMAQFDPNAYYALVCHTSNMALDNQSSSSYGTNEIQCTWNNSGTNQAWQLAPNGGLANNYTLYNVANRLVLDNRGSTAAGSDVGQWGFQLGNPNQRWNIEPCAGTYYYGVPDYSLACASTNDVMCLDNGGGDYSGTSVTQWPLGASPQNTNQQWSFRPMYRWAAITFETGGDDLRGTTTTTAGPFGTLGQADSWVNITLTIDGASQTYADVSSDQNWSSGSFHTVYVPVPGNWPVANAVSGDVNVTLGQWSQGTDSPDMWDVQAVSVTLTSYNPTLYPSLPTRNNLLEARKTVYSGSGSSTWQVFDTTTPSHDFVFQHVGYEPYDYYFGP